VLEWGPGAVRGVQALAGSPLQRVASITLVLTLTVLGLQRFASPSETTQLPPALLDTSALFVGWSALVSVLFAWSALNTFSVRHDRFRGPFRRSREPNSAAEHFDTVGRAPGCDGQAMPSRSGVRGFRGELGQVLVTMRIAVLSSLQGLLVILGCKTIEVAATWRHCVERLHPRNFGCVLTCDSSLASCADVAQGGELGTAEGLDTVQAVLERSVLRRLLKHSRTRADCDGGPTYRLSSYPNGPEVLSEGAKACRAR
jgi:hypothetical protein